MVRPLLPLLLPAALLLLAPAAAGQTIPPLPWVEIVRAPDAPASVFCTPAGTGCPFTVACGFGGASLDATLEIVLWSDEPGWGEPIAGFPREDIWLEAGDGGLAPCPGGTVADAPTDAQGRTHWALPLRTGGWLDPDTGAELLIMVNGSPASMAPLTVLRFNSADLDRDGRVNLADAGGFTRDLFGAYTYRSDFVWDGVINVSDAGRMAAALGVECP